MCTIIYFFFFLIKNLSKVDLMYNTKAQLDKSLSSLGGSAATLAATIGVTDQAWIIFPINMLRLQLAKASRLIGIDGANVTTSADISFSRIGTLLDSGADGHVIPANSCPGATISLQPNPMRAQYTIPRRDRSDIAGNYSNRFRWRTICSVRDEQRRATKTNRFSWRAYAARFGKMGAVYCMTRTCSDLQPLIP